MRAEGKELRGQGTMRMTKMALDSSNNYSRELPAKGVQSVQSKGEVEFQLSLKVRVDFGWWQGRQKQERESKK